MSCKKILFLIISISTLTFSQPITDLLQPIYLSPGKIDTILVSDLYYAEKYSPEFKANPELNILYLPKSNQLVLSAKRKNFGASLLEFTSGKDRRSLPVLVNASAASRVIHQFSYTQDASVKEVFVEGSFNDWNKQSHPLAKNAAGTFSTTILLEPGSYTYKFIVDGKEIVDPQNPETAPTGFESFNSVLRVENPDTAKIFLHIGGKNEEGKKIIFSFYVESNTGLHGLTKKNIFALLDNKKISEKDISIKQNRIEVQSSKTDLRGEKNLRLFVSYNGKNTNIQHLRLFNGLPAGNAHISSPNSSWYDGVIYSIMVDRFNNGDTANDNPIQFDSLLKPANYQGGDFRGIIKKIEEGYFDSLGISILWISPVYDNPNVAFREYPPPHRWYSGYHGYWPINEFFVEEKFGTMDELKELVAKAHKHKIKVLLDIVAHHVHIDNPLYKEHPDWFGTLDLPDGRKNLRLWDEQRLTTWFEPYMPSFDYTKSPAPINFMTDNCIWWLKETGADGFRHDAVKHVPNEFWRALTKKVKEEIEIPEKKEVYQIGETFGDYNLVASYVNNGQLSAQFNFNLSYFAIPVFLEPEQSFSVLDFQMKKSFEAFGVNNLMGNIMDSHDKVRFMAYADGDVAMQGVDTRELAWTNPPVVNNPQSYKKAELYFAYLFSIPGLPVVYYGSEFGMTGADDPDNRRMMRFGNDLSVEETKMLHVTSQLINIRNQHSALRYGDFYTLRADKNIYAYLRSDMNERVLVVLNKSSQEQSVELNIPQEIKIQSAKDIVSGKTSIMKKNILEEKIPALSWKIFSVSY
ncbi:MAG: alpha-glucosidase C-terminal domain-containing protein [Bacteroidetes bacterium]|nr:alpha-glucosidase C-terminal domain-containing protein [Bacteroidota bacterium]